MPRRFHLILAAATCLAGSPCALAQDASPALTSTTMSDPGDNVTELKAQNAALKKEVADAAKTIAKLQAQLAQNGVTPTSTEAPAPGGPQKALPLDAPNPALEGTNAASGTAPAIDLAGARSYTVVKGDSLWKIAHKEYPGDTKNGVDKLTEANKDTIAGKPLKIGQVLVVPK